MLLHTCSRQRYFIKFEYLYFVIGVVTVVFLLIFAIVILSCLRYQGSNAKTIRLSASLALLPIRSNATSALLRPPSFITQAYAVPILAQRATAARGVISALPV